MIICVRFKVIYLKTDENKKAMMMVMTTTSSPSRSSPPAQTRDRALTGQIFSDEDVAGWEHRNSVSV